MKKLNLVFGILMAMALTFSSCYKEDLNFDEAAITQDQDQDDFEEDYGDSDQDDSDDDDDYGDSDHDHNHDFDGEEFNSIANYSVDGDFIIQTNSNSSSEAWMNDQAKHQFMWDYFIKMIDPDNRRWIVEFEVFNGGGQLLGYVEPIKEGDLTRWKLALAIDNAYTNGTFDVGGDFTHTIIHEYAHVITLNETQINSNFTDCDTYKNAEGCTYESSFIHQFQTKFWASIMNDHEEAIENYDEQGFYSKYQDHFVTPYAATNPEEDLAEVFTHFVTSDTAPQGSTIANQKVRYLYEFQELVDLRNQIRQGVAVMPETGTWSRSKLLNLKKFSNFSKQTSRQ